MPKYIDPVAGEKMHMNTVSAIAPLKNASNSFSLVTVKVGRTYIVLAHTPQLIANGIGIGLDIRPAVLDIFVSLRLVMAPLASIFFL